MSDNNRCIQQDIGKLLHAYELKALDENEERRFEEHLMMCDYCWQQARSLEGLADIALSDPEILGIASRAGDNRDPLKRTPPWQKVWPRGSWVFKPLFLYALIALLLIPAIAYFDFGTPAQPEILQVISLSPSRANSGAEFSIASGKDGVIMFYFDGAVSPSGYHLRVVSDDGAFVLFDGDPGSLDKNNVGSLFIPLASMRAGKYTMTITSASPVGENFQRQYVFAIVK